MQKRQKRTKVGRNDPCPCGSGKKYKRCHGAHINEQKEVSAAEKLRPELTAKIAELEALQKQREQQQGLGRPVISTVSEGYRLVMVGSACYSSKAWRTLHDFLLDYIKIILGREWFSSEFKKQLSEQHPVIQWYKLVNKHLRDHFETPGKVHSAPMTGAALAYLGLAYNLYLLAHNVELQRVLIKRLKRVESFPGAYYETYVAATFIKAGFRLEFENELDSSTTHCEFTATFQGTGRKFSVEAKAREPDKPSAQVGNQLYKALCKKAKHTRVVFIDVNVPDNVDESGNIRWLNEAVGSMREKEDTMTIDGLPAPEAHVFLTNYPYRYNLDSTTVRWAVIGEGFKIPDFKKDSQFADLREALKSRERHSEMFKLLDSIKVHHKIPSTFDGEIPEFAFDETPPRLKIGHRYAVPNSEGVEVVGELIDALVFKDKAIGVYKLDDSSTVMVSTPLTEIELSAYKQHPDTFFGVYSQKERKTEDPLDFFDFLYNSYRHTPKERLLELLKNYPDNEQFEQLSQEELAFKYCEGIVYSAFNPNQNSS